MGESLDSPARKGKAEALKKLRETKKLISQQSYVKENPEYEKRRRFFSPYLKDEKSSSMINSLMKEIGYF